MLVVPAILSQSTNQIAAFPFSTSTVPPNRGKASTRSRSVDSLSVCENPRRCGGGWFGKIFMRESPLSLSNQPEIVDNGQVPEKMNTLLR